MSKLNVVVIDDETDIFKLYQVYLKSFIETEKINLVTYEDGNLFYNDINDSKLDMTKTVVLCDINMPAINGFDLLEKVMKNHKLPFYMVTAYNREDYRTKSKELGAIDLIPKPVNFKELIVLLEESYL